MKTCTQGTELKETWKEKCNIKVEWTKKRCKCKWIVNIGLKLMMLKSLLTIR